MSWQDVKVKIEGAEYDGKMRGNEIFVPILVEDETPTVEVDGKPAQVESVRIDDRDSVVYITVKADAKKQRSKSDDKPVEGRDDDKAGGGGV
jgi:hypothetical protein